MLKDGEVIAHDTRTGKEKWRSRGPQSSVLALTLAVRRIRGQMKIKSGGTR